MSTKRSAESIVTELSEARERLLEAEQAIRRARAVISSKESAEHLQSLKHISGGLALVRSALSVQLSSWEGYRDARQRG